ncbi:MAG TPA: PnuC protein [Candidatus Paceibacterota bacterium]
MDNLIEFFTKFYGIDIFAMLLTFTGIYLIGNKKKYGFIVALFGNIIWVCLGLWVQSIGLMFANFVIVILYVRNYIKWKESTDSEVK